MMEYAKSMDVFAAPQLPAQNMWLSSPLLRSPETLVSGLLNFVEKLQRLPSGTGTQMLIHII